MKQILLALVTLVTATQVFAISPRCEKALIEDATARVLEQYPKTFIQLKDASARNEAHDNIVRVFIPGGWNSRSLTFDASFLVFYKVQDDSRCTDVVFGQVQYFQADYSLGGAASGD